MVHRAGIPGVAIYNVQPGSPAAAAGLRGAWTRRQMGDVIQKANQISVNTSEQFYLTLEDCKPGDTVTLEVFRDGQTIQVPLKLGPRPNNNGIARGVLPLPTFLLKIRSSRGTRRYLHEIQCIELCARRFRHLIGHACCRHGCRGSAENSPGRAKAPACSRRVRGPARRRRARHPQAASTSPSTTAAGSGSPTRVEYPYPCRRGDEARATRVKILEDFGPDGQARKITTFADGLNIPIGVLPLPSTNAALVHSIPNIYLLRDTDGDGKADSARSLYGLSAIATRTA